MRLVSLLVAAIVAMVPQVAFAACELEPTAPVPVPAAAIGKTVAEAIPPEFIQGLKARLPDCSETEIVQAVLAANNWQSSTRLQEGATIRAVRLKTVAVAPVAAAAPAPKPAASVEVTQVRDEQAQVRQEQARMQTQRADIERAVQTFLKNNPVRAEWTPAQLASFNQAMTTIAEHDRKIKALDGRLTSLETRMTTLEGAVDDKADKAYVDQQLGNKANVGDSYTKAETDKMFDELPAGESFPWWAKIALGVIALVAGYAAFVRKMPKPDPIDTSDFVTKSELDAVREDVADVREQGGYKVIMLEHDWRQKTMQLAEGDEQTLRVFSDGKPSHTILVRRGPEDTAFIISGVGGHVASNAVKVGNLQTIVRTAANPKNFRLNNPIGLAAVA